MHVQHSDQTKNMVSVHFTPNLKKHVKCSSVVVAGSTVREVLDAVFSEHPILRGYVLEDQGSVRPHVVIFLDGKAIQDRTHLSDQVREQSDIYVMQALSGG